MPEIIPLYDHPPKAAVETALPLNLNPSCSRCPLHQGVRTVCMPADGAPGGLLVVGLYPGRIEDNVGRPNVGDSGKLLRVAVSKHWTGPVVYDNALRCAPGKRPIVPSMIDACRGYLAQTVKDAKPTRIVALGEAAVESVLGRKVKLLDVRRGYSWLVNAGAEPIPVFFVLHPAAGLRNRFLRAMFEEDLRWALTVQEPPFRPAWGGVAKIIGTVEDALECEKEMLAAPWFSHDVETAGQLFAPFQILCGAMARPGSDDAWVWDHVTKFSNEIRAVQARLLRNPRALKVGTNYKFDENAHICDGGVRVVGHHSDCRLKRKLMDAEADGHLKTMAELVGMGGHKADAHAAMTDAKKAVGALIRANKSGQTTLFGKSIGDMRPDVADTVRDGPDREVWAYAFLPRRTRLQYVARDALSTARLESVLDVQLRADDVDLQKTWAQTVFPCSEAIRQVEEWGVAVSRDAMESFHLFLEAQRQTILPRLHAYDAKFNPGSPQQVAKLLFDRLKLPRIRDNSTDEEVLTALKDKHPIIADLLELRGLDKLDGTYARGLQAHIRPDGRIHPNILIDGARSGRPSCRDPNLQNIPRIDDKLPPDQDPGTMARNCFIARPGYVLLSLDYSQLELRIAAMLSGDDVMRQIFLDGGDFHKRTAQFISQMVWGIPPEKVLKYHRSAAKAFNFGILYGQGDDAIAEKAGITISDARKVREAVLGKFAKLARWIDQRLAYSRKYGIAWTWWDGRKGRRRPLWQLGGDDAAAGTAERSSWNTPIQGTGSEYCVMSLIAVVQWLLEDAVPARLMLPVHDSLLLEVREDCIQEVAYQVHRIMTSWPAANDVPITVDVDIGTAWGSLAPCCAEFHPMVKVGDEWRCPSCRPKAA